eukprot:62864-Rhodomonas_salina.3
MSVRPRPATPSQYRRRQQQHTLGQYRTSRTIRYAPTVHPLCPYRPYAMSLPPTRYLSTCISEIFSRANRRAVSWYKCTPAQYRISRTNSA